MAGGAIVVPPLKGLIFGRDGDEDDERDEPEWAGSEDPKTTAKTIAFVLLVIGSPVILGILLVLWAVGVI